MRIQKNRFYRAYAISPVSIRISGFCLTKIPGLIAKAALVCACLSVFLFLLTATSALFKIPFLHHQRICIQKCTSIHSVGPLPLQSRQHDLFLK